MFETECRIVAEREKYTYFNTTYSVLKCQWLKVDYCCFASFLQVQMVTQQEIKSYKLLSSNSMQFRKPNDPRYKDMWYIVSVMKGVSLFCFVVT